VGPGRRDVTLHLTKEKEKRFVGGASGPGVGWAHG